MKKKNKKISSNRSFGIVFALIFLIIGLWPILDNENLKILPLIISMIFLILGIIKSKILTPLKNIWVKLGTVLGIFISPIVMGIIFFIIVTPTAFLMRLLGKDILNLKNDNSKSYWISKEKIKSTMKDQF